MGYFQVRYDFRIVIYDHRAFIRLTTESPLPLDLVVQVAFGFYGPTVMVQLRQFRPIKRQNQLERKIMNKKIFNIKMVVNRLL